MPSFSFLPPEQEVYVFWPDGPSLPLKRSVAGQAEPSMTELYRLTMERPEFFVGRFEYLRALELRRLRETSGLTARLAETERA